MEYWESVFRTCDYRVIKEFLEDNPDIVNYKTIITRETPLHLAMDLIDCRDKNRIVEEILKYSPDVNAEDFSGQTPIFMAAYQGNLKLFYRFIDSILDFDEIVTFTENGTTLFMKAVEGGNPEIIDWILENVETDINASNDNGETALSLAAQYGNLPVFEYLIDLGATANFPLLAETILGIPYSNSKGGHWEIIEYLLKSGEDINADNTGATPLYRAVQSGELEIVKYLIEHGADVNMGDEFGTTPLQRAVHQNMIDIVEYLIEQGANVDLQDESGSTALIDASREGYLEIVKYLVEHGANVDLKSNNRYTAMDVAEMGHYPDIVSYLRFIHSSRHESPIRMRDRYGREIEMTGRMGRGRNNHMLYESK